MAHDKLAIHVSHYLNSPTWRSAVAPDDRSWLLFIDVQGSPHLYLATETRDGDSENAATVTTYAPCVRAMLHADVLAGLPPSPPLDTQGFHITITTQPDDAAHPFVARCGDALARPGRTRREAVMRALEEFFPEDAAALAASRAGS